ncbi:MAG: murein peptide amidase A [Planctomycetes bacterium]|nr:murein peptide amidase A [Planctomycetota bacterium]
MMKKTSKFSRWVTGVFMIVCVLACGCAQQAEVQGPTVAYPDPMLGVETMLPTAQVRVGGRSLMNRIVLYDILGQGQDTTLIIATIHGNEDAGTPLVRRLYQHLRENTHLLAGRTVVIMPVANPDGRAARVRYNARGVDLNRNFESDNRVNNEVHGKGALSEPESEIITRIITEYRPNKIVTLHQPLSCVDYDGPGRGLAEAMAQRCPLPVKKLGARPGSLGAYSGESLNIPTITLEMNASDSKLSDQALWDTYGRALLAAIQY